MRHKPQKHRLIPFVFALFFLIIALVVPTNFSVLMPGKISKVESNIQIEDVDNLDNFYTTSVYYLTRVNAVTRMILELDHRNNVSPMSSYESSLSNTDDFLMGQVSKKYSYHSSLINAYREASKMNPDVTLEYKIDSLLLYYRPSKMSSLKIGDVVTKLNDQIITTENFQEVINNSRTPSVKMTILRDNQEIDFSYTYEKGDYYLSFYPNIEIISSTPSFSLPGLNSTTGGPSGGLMQTINIYVSLLKLNFGDLKIAGTGTINLEGSVGKIGGAVQKIHTVNKAGVDIFIIAFDNHYEVVNIDKNFEYFPVKTFQEAVVILNEYIVH